MAIKMTITPRLTLSLNSSVSTSSLEASTHEGNMTMSKFAKVIAHSALVATLLTLLSTVASASAVWGN